MRARKLVAQQNAINATTSFVTRLAEPQDPLRLTGWGVYAQPEPD
jgi:hypothetical protein